MVATSAWPCLNEIKLHPMPLPAYPTTPCRKSGSLAWHAVRLPGPLTVLVRTTVLAVELPRSTPATQPSCVRRNSYAFSARQRRTPRLPLFFFTLQHQRIISVARQPFCSVRLFASHHPRPAPIRESSHSCLDAAIDDGSKTPPRPVSHTADMIDSASALAP